MQDLWLALAHVLSPCIDLFSYLTKNNVFWGVEASKIVNHIFLLTKQYIFRQRCIETKCSTEGLLVEIQDTYNIEMHIPNGANRRSMKNLKRNGECWKE